jgi:para-aminobenzoate synthetase component 1
MIVDLVRNDLSAICDTGSVNVPELLRVEEHPGLVHLVSRVAGELRSTATWPEILASTFPPGSVTGAPKSSALRIIDDVESVSRDVYCGAIGWVHGEQAEIAVGIRTFWRREPDVLHFGTGAGITWASDASAEWDETRLKANRLLTIAGGAVS